MAAREALGTHPATDHVAEVLPLRPAAPKQDTGVEMDSAIAADWGLWSEQIGLALVPILRRAVQSTPAITSALITTADGFNLCALGLDEAHISHVSAMTGALLSIAESVTDVFDDSDDHAMDLVSLAHGGHTTVVLAVRQLIIGQVLVWLTGQVSEKTLIESVAGDLATSVEMLLGDR